MPRIKIALSAVALIAVVAAALPPAHAEGLTVPVKGGSRMCLTAPAAHRLTEVGIALRAGGPARLTGRDRTCVDLPVTRGAVSLDLAKGGAAMDGSIIFEGRRQSLTLSDLYSHPGRTRTSAEATVGRGRARPIDLLDYTVTPEHFRVGVTQIKATDVAMKLTRSGADVFTEAFGTSPLRPGEQLFSGEATVDLIRSTTGALGSR